MTTPDVPFRLEISVELPGTPEQVWQAIATGPGLTSWFLPTDLEPREGGAIAFHMGETSSEGTITGWDPPRRVEYVEPDWAELAGHAGADGLADDQRVPGRGHLGWHLRAAGGHQRVRHRGRLGAGVLGRHGEALPALSSTTSVCTSPTSRDSTPPSSWWRCPWPDRLPTSATPCAEPSVPARSATRSRCSTCGVGCIATATSTCCCGSPSPCRATWGSPPTTSSGQSRGGGRLALLRRRAGLRRAVARSVARLGRGPDRAGDLSPTDEFVRPLTS